MVSFKIGFLPLVDAALPIVAQEAGFAAKHGVSIEMVRDPSWATVRDRLIYGQTDAAHLLAPLALATSMGLSDVTMPLAAPFMLGLNGNAIAAGARVAAMIAEGGISFGDIAQTGRRLADIARKLADEGRKLRLAVVHRYSSHNYMLRYWLAACGCDPDRDVEIIVVPPPFIAAALAHGEIDISCVGEPWSSVAVERGGGVIIASTSQIWSRGVEKLLAFRSALLEVRRDDVEALLRALHEAGRFVADAAHIDDVAAILARSVYIDQPKALIARALRNRLVLAQGMAETPVKDFLLLHQEAANFPWRSQAMWLYSQMVRWGHAPLDPDGFENAASVFRPDIYRSALKNTDAILPGASAKVEGAIQTPAGVASVGGRLILGPDSFFDGRAFDPDKALDYLNEQMQQQP
ncbi:MAG: ABC transporter substrate-binding protein [Parvibaculum sp.]|uniref:CmpA/NrtA family ABC transporter substrate-binding protein n=1 Tax=Parvibaculum sp. TaxID=2024848 RepID=UPI0025E9406D|nr:CmpA/NrtA family ABC transporter substrate-binding protein [Parvibaculum sp.]MCE9650491.1 ABC transporter substrate-binding protein [Parvibaculum sp.]